MQLLVLFAVVSATVFYLLIIVACLCYVARQGAPAVINTTLHLNPASGGDLHYRSAQFARCAHALATPVPA